MNLAHLVTGFYVKLPFSQRLLICFSKVKLLSIVIPRNVSLELPPITELLKYLLTETCKVKMSFSPPLLSDVLILSVNSSYHLRSRVTVNRRYTITTKFGFETVSTIGTIL